MEAYIKLANKNLTRAKEIIDELSVQEVWRNIGAKANLIGSVSTRLLMKNLDIDFHVYSREFSFEDSFMAISCIAKNPKISRLSCYNFLDKDDKSFDWHLHYIDIDKQDWRIDIIQLLQNSPYVGKAERITEIINRNINNRIRETILQIKYNAQDRNIDFKGIEVYKAVFEDKIETIDEFIEWKTNNNIKRNLWEISEI